MESPENRFMRHIVVDPTTGCWLWTSYVNKATGYGKFRIGTKAADKSHEAHRAAFMLFAGIIPEGLCVLHKCDVRHCVRPHHLFLGTNADNSRDMVAKKRQPYGATKVNAKLNDAAVIKILTDMRANHVIAADYGVCKSKISAIKTGRVWKHLSGPLNG